MDILFSLIIRFVYYLLIDINYVSIQISYSPLVLIQLSLTCSQRTTLTKAEARPNRINGQFEIIFKNNIYLSHFVIKMNTLK